MPSLKISCAAIVDDAGRTLLVRKANTDFYMQPGGKIEPDETPLAALKRELMEELGLSLPDAQMRYLGNFSEVAANEPDVMLAADIFFIRHNVEPKVSGEIAECIWLDPLHDARDDLAPLTQNVVLGLVRKYREASATTAAVCASFKGSS
jgi:8-oxo-dGTP pyrophosphatase MutT (NUDIX family)